MAERQPIKADRRLYTDASGETMVEESDPRAALLFCAAVKAVAVSDQERFELELDDHDRVVWPGLELGEPEPPDEAPLRERAAWIRARLDKLKEEGQALYDELEELVEQLGDEEGWEPDDEDDEEEGEEELAEWTLKSTPEEYLEKTPDGPQAELARAHIAAAEGAGE